MAWLGAARLDLTCAAWQAQAPCLAPCVHRPAGVRHLCPGALADTCRRYALPERQSAQNCIWSSIGTARSCPRGAVEPLSWGTIPGRATHAHQVGGRTQGLHGHAQLEYTRARRQAAALLGIRPLQWHHPARPYRCGFPAGTPAGWCVCTRLLAYEAWCGRATKAPCCPSEQHPRDQTRGLVHGKLATSLPLLPDCQYTHSRSRRRPWWANSPSRCQTAPTAARPTSHACPPMHQSRVR